MGVPPHRCQEPEGAPDRRVPARPGDGPWWGSQSDPEMLRPIVLAARNPATHAPTIGFPFGPF